MKRLCIAILYGCMLWPAGEVFSAVPAGTGYEQLLQKATQLMASHKDSEALLLYEQVLTLAPQHYEALCTASLLHCRIGERFGDETRKIQHFSKARAYAQQAYELQPKDAEANYVMALSMGCEAMVSGPKQRLVNIHQLKTFVDAALADNPQHAGAWHILGRWYYKMANLNVVEKTAAKAFFGGLCATVTNEDAAAALAQAVAYDASNIRYYYDLACVYADIEAKEACIATLQAALALHLETTEELELSRRCKVMLQKLQK